MSGQLKRNEIRADLFFLVPFCLLYAGGGALVIWDAARRQQDTGAAQDLNPVGILMLALGVSLAVTGAITLRSNYSSSLVIRSGHELVTHGVYRFIRHPIYTGAILVSLGLPITASSWIALAPMILLIPFFVYRMNIEEDLLELEFGEAYSSYKARTRRLIPFLY